MEKMREGWLDAVKTIAIFIVLLNHAQVRIPGVNFWGGMFYVPVFFVLAGFTYRTKEISYSEYIKGKAKRLLLPYFVANLFYLAFFTCKEWFVDGGLHTVGLQSVIGIFYARNQLCLSARVLPEKNVFFLHLQNAPTWFLPALFVSLVVFDGLMRLFRADLKKMGLCISIGLLVQFLYHYSSPLLLPWSIDAIPFFAALLEVGFAMKKTEVLRKVCEGQKVLWLSLAMTAVFLPGALWNGSANLSIGEYGKSMIVALYNAVMASYLIMLLCFALEKKGERTYLPQFLIRPGACTLTILCYHLFVFLFLQSGIMVLLTAAGMQEKIPVVSGVKILMILLTIGGFTWIVSGVEKYRRRAQT